VLSLTDAQISINGKGKGNNLYDKYMIDEEALKTNRFASLPLRAEPNQVSVVSCK